MKTQAVTWMVALALTGICVGQETEEEKQFEADYLKSEQRAVATYPDTTDPQSAILKRMVELDKQMLEQGDQRYHSPDKPMILADLAAKELGIKPVAPKPNPVPKLQAPVVLDGKVIPEMSGYTSVTIRNVEPDGLRVMHDTGISKIPIENLTEEQRAKYGITMDGAAQYRKQVAANASARPVRQQEATRTQPEAPRPAPEALKFITADQIKRIWVRKLKAPHKLDPNYSKIIKSYQEFIADIKAGNRDLDAQETAASYNRSLAIDAGNMEVANTFQAELARITQAKSAAKALAQREAQARRQREDFMRLEMELYSINRNLRRIDKSVSPW